MLFISVLLLLLSLSYANDIGFQLHSYDDLNQWDAYLFPNWPGSSPRAQFMKVDIQYVPPGDCGKLRYRPQDCSNGTIVLAHNPASQAPDIQYWFGDDLLNYFRARPSISRFGLALCGKTPDQVNRCGSDRLGRAFRSTLDSFMENLIKWAPNVELIIDGSLVPLDAPCLLNRWGNYSSTWQGKPVTALFSNDSPLDANFQVFNVPVLDPKIMFEPYVLLDYGKFSRQERFPYLVWEPSDQSTIMQVEQYYRNGPQHQPAGIRFAINISPERFLVFGADFNKQAWNLRVPQTANISVAFAFAIPSASNIVMFQWNETDGTLYGRYLPYSYWFGNLTSSMSNQQLQPILKSRRPISARRQAGSTTSFLLCDVSGACFDVVARISSLSFSAQQHATNFPGRLLWAGPSSNGLVSLTVSNGCSLWQSDIGCRLKGVNVTSASAAFAGDGKLRIAFTDDSANVFYLNGGVAVPIGVGSSVSLDVVGNMLCLTASDSFCWNTEPKNKDVVRTCSMTPSSTPGVLSYFCGLVDDWDALHGTQYLTSCNTKIRTGSFDQGSNSFMSLALDEGGQPLLLEIHRGASFANQAPECGNAIEYDGIVVDSFPL